MVFILQQMVQLDKILEKANWYIFLVPSIQVSQLFQAGWRFWEQQIYPALRHQGYYFLMGSWKHE